MTQTEQDLDDDFINNISAVEVEVQSVFRLHRLNAAICYHSIVLQPEQINYLLITVSSQFNNKYIHFW